MADLSNATTAVATLGTMVVAIVAAVSSLRSARAAERQVQHAEKVQRLRLERELNLAAQRVMALSIAVMDTGGQLVSAYDVHSLVFGEPNERQRMVRIEAIQKRMLSASGMQEAAMGLLGRRDTWKNNTDDELVAHLSVQEGNAVQLERARARLDRDLEKHEGLVREEQIRLRDEGRRVGGG